MREFDVGGAAEHLARALLRPVLRGGGRDARRRAALRPDRAIGCCAFAALFVPVWWAWTQFTWFATAWDNDDLLHRLGMFAAMLLVIVLAASIPRVLRGNDQVFVLAYVGMQVLLVAMFARVLPPRRAGTTASCATPSSARDRCADHARVAVVDAPLRYWIWALAVLVLMVAPVFAVRAYEGQPFDSQHLPERYGLFTIIVLGESVVAVGVGLGEVRLDGGAVASAAAGVRHRGGDLVELLRDRLVVVAVPRAHLGVVRLGVRTPVRLRRYRGDRRSASSSRSRPAPRLTMACPLRHG